MPIRRLAVVACLFASAATASAQDEVLYALSFPVSPVLTRLDPSNGQVLGSSAVSGHEALFGGLAMDAAGDLYSIDGYNDGNEDRLFRISRDSGAGVVVGNTGHNWNFRNVTVHPGTDALYATTDNRLYSVDRVTGAAVLIANIAGGGGKLDQLTSMAIGTDGMGYGTDIIDTDLFRIDLATGVATHLGVVGQSFNWYEDLAFDAGGTLWGARLLGGLYTISIDTPGETFRFGGSYNGLAFPARDASCYADCNADGSVNIFDFLCFQGKVTTGDPEADCNGDGSVNIFDFLCFQGAVTQGC